MWICLSDAFLSIVAKDCRPTELLVRARRQGDIERVFGRRTKVIKTEDADYLYRAIVPRKEVVAAMSREVSRITYPNFKNTVQDTGLHMAYMAIWRTMADEQETPPYSAGLPLSSSTRRTATARKAVVR